MVDEFEVAIGTITGRSHTMISKNNQDAYCLKRLKETIIAVVCDGCSEG
ncbi:MAG: protein phosphatase, partial [Candidatus Aenigmarchaeota archaeon]|nr:protein phosphatase [Candidatus Aenigmarchaeota archaeon]